MSVMRSSTHELVPISPVYIDVKCRQCEVKHLRPPVAFDDARIIEPEAPAVVVPLLKTI